MGCENSKNKMKIVIQTLTGNQITLKVDGKGSDTVLIVKAMIQAKQGMLPENQRLIFGGKALENDRTLASYNIVENSKVHLVLGMGNVEIKTVEPEPKK